MSRSALAIALLAAACYEDSYRCTSDADCDVDGGRCERDRRCSAFDVACPSRQRYTAHSGDRAGACFDDSVVPPNPCAPGQPPARAEGCFADVCRALPACCATGWSEACVQDAQLRCELACDTRIAMTATAGATRELWQLRWDGAAWHAERSPFQDLTVWLAPRPGELEPRPAGLVGGTTFVVGAPGDQVSFPLASDHAYQAAASIDFDRAARDTVALTYQTGTPVAHFLEVLDVDGGATRSYLSQVSTRLTWGDDDHDAFPDGVAGLGPGFRFLDNAESPEHVRALAITKSAGVGADPTGGSVPLRGFDWVDLDGDGLLDLAAFGSSLRVHLGNTDEIPNGPSVNLDCEPPVPAGTCATPAGTSYAGVAVPSILPGVRPAVAISTFEAPFGGRNVYLVSIRQRSPVVLDIATIDRCPTCAPLIALAARALDRDQMIDLVGIDTHLHVWTALSSRGFTFVESTPIATALSVKDLTLSTTGAIVP